MGGLAVLVMPLLISPHPLQHFSYHGKSYSSLLYSLSQHVVTLAWFNAPY